jgi:hypothetical protein
MSSPLLTISHGDEERKPNFVFACLGETDYRRSKNGEQGRTKKDPSRKMGVLDLTSNLKRW